MKTEHFSCCVCLCYIILDKWENVEENKFNECIFLRRSWNFYVTCARNEDDIMCFLGYMWLSLHDGSHIQGCGIDF
jgi:hypothetical protein